VDRTQCIAFYVNLSEERSISLVGACGSAEYVRHTYVVGEDDAPFPDLILPVEVRQTAKNI
jgi:hypothetical protein